MNKSRSGTNEEWIKVCKVERINLYLEKEISRHEVTKAKAEDTVKQVKHAKKKAKEVVENERSKQLTAVDQMKASIRAAAIEKAGGWIQRAKPQVRS